MAKKAKIGQKLTTERGNEMTIFYMPLEPYKARYTIQLSRAKDGWFERRLNDLGVSYQRVEGKRISDSADISTGVVLDAYGRSYWSLIQMANLVGLLHRGAVKDSDAIYLEDFWSPGFEALPYIRAQSDVDFKLFALLHAQSVDTYDFTYPMRDWLRHFELGQAKELDGIFVTNSILKYFLEAAMFSPKQGIFVTGLPYASDEVRETARPYNRKKENLAVFTSRWDDEKDPLFFLDVVGYVNKKVGDRIKFEVTTSHPKIKSNNQDLVEAALNAERKFDNLTFKTGLEKWEYYRALQRAKVQFNCSHQDFTSWTLLEATTFGCLPCYPNWRSFPETFRGNQEFLYAKGDVKSAGNKIIEMMDWNNVNVDWIYKPFDRAAERMVNIMQGKEFEPLFQKTPE